MGTPAMNSHLATGPARQWDAQENIHILQEEREEKNFLMPFDQKENFFDVFCSTRGIALIF